MARAQSTDFYHVFKFHVKVVTAGIVGGSEIQGGFVTATIPEATLEKIEYKEGIWVYKRKFPGNVEYGDLTLTKGVAKKGTALWDWLDSTTLGNEYRVDLQILHFHRDDVIGLADFTQATPKRIINCYECWPIRVKAGSDLDSNASEVSIQECDIAVERMELVDTNT